VNKYGYIYSQSAMGAAKADHEVVSVMSKNNPRMKNTSLGGYSVKTTVIDPLHRGNISARTIGGKGSMEFWPKLRCALTEGADRGNPKHWQWDKRREL
jgi:hypothetical protein